MLLLLACTQTTPTPEPASAPTRQAPQLTELRLPILKVEQPFRWDAEFRGLATAAMELGLYDLPGVVPHISAQVPSPSDDALKMATRVVDARFFARGTPEKLELELELCVAGGLCESTLAEATREAPWPAFGALLEGAAATLGVEVPEAVRLSWSKAGSRDSYAELLTGRAAALYYGILPLPDPLPAGKAHPVFRAVLVDPRQPIAQWTWARWQMGTLPDAGKASESLGRAMLERPDSPLFAAQRAWLAGRAGHREEALLDWQEILGNHKDDPRFLEPTARALFATGRADDARSLLLRLPDAFLWIPEVAQLRVEVTEAVEGTENLDPLLEHWQRTDSMTVLPVRRRIELRVQRRDYEGARALVGVLRTRAPGPATDALEVALLVALGRLDLAMGRAPEEVAARLSLRAALQVDPGAELGEGEEDIPALLARAQAALWRNDPEAALQLLGQATCMPPCTDAPERLALLARALEAQGRSTEAVEAWKQAWLLDPALEGGPVQNGRVATAFRLLLPPEAPPKDEAGKTPG